MSRHIPLTRLAHQLLAAHIEAGDSVVDATAGNGHDTLFLACQVGPAGQVHAFDIQQQALDNTRARLQQAGCPTPVYLHHASHAQMQTWIPAELHGRIAAITFNLGYLPGSDHATVTRRDTTLAALAQSLDLLRPGGLLSVLAYRGHPGGQEEALGVETWLERQPRVTLDRHESPGPVLYTAHLAR